MNIRPAQVDAWAAASCVSAPLWRNIAPSSSGNHSRARYSSAVCSVYPAIARTAGRLRSTLRSRRQPAGAAGRPAAASGRSAPRPSISSSAGTRPASATNAVTRYAACQDSTAFSSCPMNTYETVVPA